MAESNRIIRLFVPGRLCLFGEHSDWAGMYRSVSSGIEKGHAIVSGAEQGIWATAEKSDRFIMTTAADFPEEESWECEMDTAKLQGSAQRGGYFSYVAGVASYINDNYSVGGVKIAIEKSQLPEHFRLNGFPTKSKRKMPEIRYSSRRWWNSTL